jgi:hypothetical protein
MAIQQIENDAWIDRPAPGSHHQAVECREAHCRRDASAAGEGTETAAATQVSDDRAPGRGPGVVLRKYCGDVFAGQTVESVAREAVVLEAPRQRERLRERWLRPVKSRIETRDLRQVRR